MATGKKTRRDGADRPDAGSGGWRRAAVAALLLAGLAGCEGNSVVGGPPTLDAGSDLGSDLGTDLGTDLGVDVPSMDAPDGPR